MKITRWAVGTVVGGAALLAVAVPASAHVTVDPPSAPKGSETQLALVVPNESDTANTTMVDVQMPTDHPIASAVPKALPGWSVQVKTTTLATPIQTDDGPVTSVASEIIWTATAGGTPPGQYETFSLDAGPLPTDADAVTFKTIQTYSDGSTVSWIELPDASGTAPEHPAPTLKLTAAESSDATGSSASSASTTGSTSSSATAAPATTTTSTTTKDNNGRRIGFLALLVAIAALVVGIVALTRANKARDEARK